MCFSHKHHTARQVRLTVTCFRQELKDGGYTVQMLKNDGYSLKLNLT